jgi:quercetin dioxygenase-like cupin family protein
VRHTIEGGGTVDLEAGDTITIPPNVPHQAANIGTGDAVMMVVFSAGDRQVKGE